MNCLAPDATGFLDGNIACGDTVVGTTVAAGSHVGNGASDHVYSFTLGAADAGFVQFDSCESQFDTYLRVFDASLTTEVTGCDDVSTQAIPTTPWFSRSSLKDCLCFQCGACGLQTVLDAQLAAGDYNLVIEGFSSGEGTYSVTMVCTGGGVDNAIQGPITCAGRTQTVTGDTTGAVATVGNAGGDHLYSFTIPVGSPNNFVQFDSCASTYDTYLRVMSSDMSAERHGCDDCK